jgi:hypothetical protein
MHEKPRLKAAPNDPRPHAAEARFSRYAPSFVTDTGVRLPTKAAKGGRRVNSCRTHFVVQRERLRLWRYFAYVYFVNHVDTRAIRANKINISAPPKIPRLLATSTQNRSDDPRRAAE